MATNLFTNFAAFRPQALILAQFYWTLGSGSDGRSLRLLSTCFRASQTHNLRYLKIFLHSTFYFPIYSHFQRLQLPLHNFRHFTFNRPSSLALTGASEWCFMLNFQQFSDRDMFHGLTRTKCKTQLNRTAFRHWLLRRNGWAARKRNPNDEVARLSRGWQPPSVGTSTSNLDRICCEFCTIFKD